MINRLMAPAVRLSKLLSRKNLYPWLAREMKAAVAANGGHLAILNIGAAGTISDVLDKIDGLKITSLDINPIRKPDILCDACDMQGKVADNSYDMAILMEVLEHIPTPDRALAEIRRVLKPGGILIGSTPFLFPIHGAPHDYYRYTTHGLQYLLRDYKDVKVTGRNNFGEAICVLMARMISWGKPLENVLGLIGLALALICYPPLWLLGKISGRNLGPTGYIWSGKKSL
jgi:SAM-dependent methyltransferase